MSDDRLRAGYPSLHWLGRRSLIDQWGWVGPLSGEGGKGCGLALCLLAGWLKAGRESEFGQPQGKARIATVGVNVGLEGSVPP